jgi:hypothetical protein
MTKTQLIEFLIKEMKPKNKRPEYQYPNLADAYNIPNLVSVCIHQLSPLVDKLADLHQLV